MASTCAAIERWASATYVSGSLSRSWIASRSVQARRHVAAQRVVRAGLIRDDVRPPVAADELGQNLGAVAEQADRDGLAPGPRVGDPCERLVQRVGLPVEVPGLDAALDPRGVDLDAERDAAVHGHGEGLRAAHPPEPAGQRDRAGERAAEALGGTLRERLVGALQDPLRPDVDPRTGGHLPVHREPGVLQLAEGVPVRPLRDQHRVHDQHPWRHLVRAEHRHRLPRLHEQGLVVGEVAK